MKFAKYSFLIAGIYGVIALLPQYFMEQKNNLDYPPAITHPEYFYGFIGVALAWQFAFLIISQNPARYRPLMLPAVFEKASFGVAVFVLSAFGKMSGIFILAAAIDLLLGILFLISYFKAGSETGDA